MQVLYIDVFFLINLTVDILSAFFAVRLLHIKSGMPRLSGIAILGSLSAVIDVFLSDYSCLRPLNSVIFLTLAGFIVASGIGAWRRIKFLLAFVVIELLLGGMVYYGYGLLDRYFGELYPILISGNQNRRALLVSVLILLAMGVLKLLIMIFSSHVKNKAVSLRIKIGDCIITTDALIDSGNLVRDPMNMNPVMFLKPELARETLPPEITELSRLDVLPDALRRRVRLVPVSRDGKTHIMIGVRADKIELITEDRCEPVEMTVVIDREGGKFGGYDALVPLDAIENV